MSYEKKYIFPREIRAVYLLQLSVDTSLSKLNDRRKLAGKKNYLVTLHRQLSKRRI